MEGQQYQHSDTAGVLDYVARGVTVERVAQAKEEHEQFCAENPQIDPNNSEWYKSMCEALTILQTQQSQQQ